jgi:hypothetical protein
MGDARELDGRPANDGFETEVPPVQAGEIWPRTFIQIPNSVPQWTGGGGIRIPGYEIVGELGRGGMGVVYQATQTALRRTVALKMLLSGGHASPEELFRFRAEATAIAGLQHPNIVQVHEVGEHNGLPFISLEFCAGGSLAGRLRNGHMSDVQAAELVETLARAVTVAHRAGIVHRDLKPANVLFTADGTPKVADFGLAKYMGEAGLTASGAVMGTPSYMAPEQALGEVRSIGPAADVYALGAILYECLAGLPPFTGKSAYSTIAKVVSAEPASPSGIRGPIPWDLETVCLKCLRKDPAQRYASAMELADDLSRFRRGEPVRVRPLPVTARIGRWIARRPAVTAGVTCTAAQWLLYLLWRNLGHGPRTYFLLSGVTLTLIACMVAWVVLRPSRQWVRLCRLGLVAAGLVAFSRANVIFLSLALRLDMGDEVSSLAQGILVAGPTMGLLVGLLCVASGACVRRMTGARWAPILAGAILGFWLMRLVLWLIAALDPQGAWGAGADMHPAVIPGIFGTFLGSVLGAWWSNRLTKPAEPDRCTSPGGPEAR